MNLTKYVGNPTKYSISLNFRLPENIEYFFTNKNFLIFNGLLGFVYTYTIHKTTFRLPENGFLLIGLNFPIHNKKSTPNGVLFCLSKKIKQRR